MQTTNYKIFSITNSAELGEQVSARLGVPVGNLYSTRFSDGEVYSRFEESIRGETILLIAQVNLPYTNLFELFVTIDAARRASAREIICVIPYLPHSRQERKDDTRSSVSARLIADFIEHSGADRIITIDMHSTSIEGFYKIPIDHISMSPVFVQHIRSHYTPESICLCSPDFGGLKRIKAYKNILNCDMAVIHKERLSPNKISSMEIIGEVQGKDVVIIDDIIDTGGTLCKAAELLKEKGAATVQAYCTHGVLSGQAIERIATSELSSLYISDTIPTHDLPPVIKVVSSADILANAISRLLQNKSVKAISQI